MVSLWELKVGVALHFSNTSPWSSAKEKEKRIGSIVAWLIPTLDLPDLLTTYYSYKLCSCKKNFVSSAFGVVHPDV